MGTADCEGSRCGKQISTIKIYPQWRHFPWGFLTNGQAVFIIKRAFSTTASASPAVPRPGGGAAAPARARPLRRVDVRHRGRHRLGLGGGGRQPDACAGHQPEPRRGARRGMQRHLAGGEIDRAAARGVAVVAAAGNAVGERPAGASQLPG